MYIPLVSNAASLPSYTERIAAAQLRYAAQIAKERRASGLALNQCMAIDCEAVVHCEQDALCPDHQAEGDAGDIHPCEFCHLYAAKRYFIGGDGYCKSCASAINEERS